MTCDRITSRLDAFLDGELDAAAASELEHHAATCAQCGTRLRRARAIVAAMRRIEVPTPSEVFFERAVAGATAPRKRERQSPRLVAAGFLGAFATSILTVIVTGLWVRSPDSRAPVSQVTMTLHETKTVNLVFASRTSLEDVAMTVELPPGVELAHHAAARRVEWHTRLSAGNNVLPLELVAIEGRGGRLVARLEHGGDEKAFVVDVDVEPRSHQGARL